VLHPGADFRLQERIDWSPFYGARLAVGVDAVAAAMLVLSGLITLVATIAAWREQRSPRTFHALVLALLAAINGVFTAQDFLLFYVSWEVLLVPMLLLIGIYGGAQRRYAALKFFVFTLAGSVLMLLLLLLLWQSTPPGTPKTFDLQQLTAQWQVWRDTPFLGGTLAGFGFFAVLLACLVKLPAVPLHTWLPHAHVQAPTAVSVLLAGVLLKLSVYGLYRIALPLFPTAAIAWGPALGALGLCGILWGAWVALGQRDLKRLVAYASVSHMGFCLLGLANLTPAGATASVVQALAHGLSSPLLFLLVGVVYDRAHHRDVDGFGGLSTADAALRMAAAVRGARGLRPARSRRLRRRVPDAGQRLRRGAPFAAFSAAATLAVVLSAAYLLWTVQRVAYGPLRHAEQAAFPDLDRRELLSMLPLVACCCCSACGRARWPRRCAPAARR
jgi:NADH-quinone oxidoreductase subunit M